MPTALAHGQHQSVRHSARSGPSGLYRALQAGHGSYRKHQCDLGPDASCRGSCPAVSRTARQMRMRRRPNGGCPRFVRLCNTLLTFSRVRKMLQTLP